MATGANHVAGSFRDQFARLKQQVEELRIDMSAAIDEFVDAVNAGKVAVKDLRAEAAEMRAAFAQGSNGPPAEEAGAP